MTQATPEAHGEDGYIKGTKNVSGSLISVLYVDDEKGLLTLGKLFLERSGQFCVDTVTSAPEALQILRSTSYDAIVSDYQMPYMDGIAFLKALRAEFPELPFIIFTGRGREDVVIEAFDNGADFYLQKGGESAPQFLELGHKIISAVRRREAEKALKESELRYRQIIEDQTGFISRFLPDATLVIDPDGKVLAWNNAIEEMTGIKALDMVGKDNYEYALPFYRTRRPMLLDLIFKPDEDIAKYYPGITRKNQNILIAKTTLAHPKGKQSVLRARASPLCDDRGTVVCAIESIRDITGCEEREDA